MAAAIEAAAAGGFYRRILHGRDVITTTRLGLTLAE